MVLQWELESRGGVFQVMRMFFSSYYVVYLSLLFLDFKGVSWSHWLLFWSVYLFLWHSNFVILPSISSSCSVNQSVMISISVKMACRL